MSLQQAIVLWLNNVQYLSQNIESFDSLSDGIIFSQLLNAVDPVFFSLDSAKQIVHNRDQQTIYKFLMEMVEKINQYRINIQCKSPDFSQIDLAQIAFKQNKQQILILFESILQVILASSLKGQFIEPILKLEEQNQEILMHFLKNHLDQEMEPQNTVWQDEGYLQQLLQKLDEVENANILLTTKYEEVKENEKMQTQQLKNLNKQLENKEIEIRAIQEQKLQQEKLYEERNEMQYDSREEEKLRQKCLEQEHRIATLSLKLDDYKFRDTQFNDLKEQYEALKNQLKIQNSLETKIEQIQERRELDKELYDRMKDKQEKEIGHLKQNIKDILKQLSEVKEIKLNLELELQQKQARIEKHQEQYQLMESEYQQKIVELEELMQSLRSSDIAEQINEISQDITPQHLSSEIMMKMSITSKQDNLEIEYYIKENHSLEGKIKDLQRQLTESQIEQESKVQRRDLETQNHQTQQQQFLNEQLKKMKDQNEALKKQVEELKKQTQVKKVTQIDYEINILQLLSEALTKKVSEVKSNREIAVDI